MAAAAAEFFSKPRDSWHCTLYFYHHHRVNSDNLSYCRVNPNNKDNHLYPFQWIPCKNRRNTPLQATAIVWREGQLEKLMYVDQIVRAVIARKCQCDVDSNTIAFLSTLA